MSKKPEVLTELEFVFKRLKAILEKTKEEIAVDLQGYIGAEMVSNKKPTYPTGRDELQIVSGRLFASFGNQPHEESDKLNELELSGFKITGDYGSKVPYANIHEEGGQAGRGLAVEIPAREYFSKGIKEYEESAPQKEIQDIENKILRILKKLET